MLPIIFLFQAAIDPLNVGGVWYTQGEQSQVEISGTGDSVVGEIIWYEGHDQEPVFDEKNPDAEAREEEILGLELLKGFEKGEDKWRKGEIYDPTSGKTYRSAIFRIDEETLGVEGCVAFVCKTQEWKRVPSEAVERVDRQPLTAR